MESFAIGNWGDLLKVVEVGRDWIGLERGICIFCWKIEFGSKALKLLNIGTLNRVSS